RILKIELDAAATGSVTIRKASDDTAIMVLPAGVESARRPFINVSSDVSGGSERNFYEKVFIKNNNVSNALLDAIISEGADPSGNLAFGLDAAKDNDASTTNRVTAPGGVTFDGDPKN